MANIDLSNTELVAINSIINLAVKSGQLSIGDAILLADLFRKIDPLIEKPAETPKLTV